MVSFSHLTNALVSTLRRFPLALISAVVGTAAAQVLVDFPYGENPTYLYNLLMTSVLGLLLFMAIPLFLERWKKDLVSKILTSAGLIFLVIYYLLLPEDFNYTSSAIVIRFILFSIALLFSITFAPFVKRDELNGFWQHNKALFVRFFFTGVYMGVFYLGLAAAMGSADYLLNIHFEGEDYLRVFILIAGILSPAFFLAGVPEKTASLEKKKDYPLGIKIFSQYILAPLLGLYAVILYAYLGKILITGVWPNGMVSYMILGFSIVGIFTYFLLYPLKGISDWAKWFSRLLFALILPLTFMLFAAVWIRISQYGLTEKRYYVVLLGIWLLAISIYFLISPKKNLKLISVSLFLIAVLSSFGPWGAISLSGWSQFNRLEEVLERNNLLVNGKVVKAQQEVSFEDRSNISGGLDYFYRFYGAEKIQPWFKEDINMMKGAGGPDSPHDLMRNELGIDYVSQWHRISYDDTGIEPEAYFHRGLYANDSGKAVEIGNYDFYVNSSVAKKMDEAPYLASTPFVIDEENYSLYTNGLNLELYRAGELVERVEFASIVQPKIDEGVSDFRFGELVFEGENFKYIPRNLSDLRLSNTGTLESVGWMEGVLLMRQ